jgi:hypothetical protein
MLRVSGSRLDILRLLTIIVGLENADSQTERLADVANRRDSRTLTLFSISSLVSPSDGFPRSDRQGIHQEVAMLST